MNRPKTIREFVYEQLKSNILAGVYRPGERLIETNLAQDLDVSRTPIRDALNRLEAEGLIETHPHRGIFVTKLSKKNIQDFYQTRTVLEGLAAQLAAENASDKELEEFKLFLDESEAVFNREKELINYQKIAEANNEFHRKICQMAKNEVLDKMLESLHNPITLIRSTAWTNDKERKYNTYLEHRAIASAILNRDGRKAREIAEEHIHKAWKAAVIALEKEEQPQENMR